MTGETHRQTLGEIAKEELREIIGKAEISTCDDLIELLDDIYELKLHPEKQAAVMKSVITLHLDGGLCEDPDGHSVVRRLLYSDGYLKEQLDKM
jgi:hypothetical protein